MLAPSGFSFGAYGIPLPTRERLAPRLDEIDPCREDHIRGHRPESLKIILTDGSSKTEGRKGGVFSARSPLPQWPEKEDLPVF